MANRKLNSDDIKQVIIDFNRGETQANLSSKWGVHPSTIRRYIREVQPTKVKPAHKVLLARKDKITLRRILREHNVINPDRLINDLDRYFSMIARDTEQEEFTIIDLGDD